MVNWFHWIIFDLSQSRLGKEQVLSSSRQLSNVNHQNLYGEKQYFRPPIRQKPDGESSNFGKEYSQLKISNENRRTKNSNIVKNRCLESRSQHDCLP